MELEHHLSSNESPIWGASINRDKEKAQNATQLLNYLGLSSGMKYMEGYNNPPVSQVSLDLGEIRSAEEFRTYDYVPISPESLAQTHGEVIPSLVDLYPDAFTNREVLVKTLGHERIHVFQIKSYGTVTDSVTVSLFERGADMSENGWWSYYKYTNGGN